MLVNAPPTFTVSRLPWSISNAENVSTDVSYYSPFVKTFKDAVAAGMQGVFRNSGFGNVELSRTHNTYNNRNRGLGDRVPKPLSWRNSGLGKGKSWRGTGLGITNGAITLIGQTPIKSATSNQTQGTKASTSDNQVTVLSPNISLNSTAGDTTSSPISFLFRDSLGLGFSNWIYGVALFGGYLLYKRR